METKKYLQARYVWKNALNLENIELERKKVYKKNSKRSKFSEKIKSYAK